MPNVVLDASVIVSAALRFPSVPSTAVLFARTHDVVCLSAAVFEEYGEVLSRAKFRAGISDDRRMQILESLRASARFYAPTVSVTDCRDPKDNKYLELALAAGAHAIVTGDADLLAHHPWRGIAILRAVDYVEFIRNRSTPATPAT